MSDFSLFTNTSARIASKADHDDYENTYGIEYHECVEGDLQPYSAGLGDREGSFADMDYGVLKECHFQFFCPDSENLKAGNYLIIDGDTYMILYKAVWDMGAEVLLKEAVLDGRRKQTGERDIERAG